MSSERYIGLDVHQATISVAVMDSHGKVVMESVLETKASTLLEFFGGLRGSLFVTFEEGTWAAWLPALARQRHQATIVRLTLARKIAAITLTLWKKGEDFDMNKLNSQPLERLEVEPFPSPVIFPRGVADRFLRRSGSRVSILNTCRHEVPTGHLASV